MLLTSRYKAVARLLAALALASAVSGCSSPERCELTPILRKAMVRDALARAATYGDGSAVPGYQQARQSNSIRMHFYTGDQLYRWDMPLYRHKGTRHLVYLGWNEPEYGNRKDFIGLYSACGRFIKSSTG